MKKQGTAFECEECHLLYEDKEWAMKCEQWCKEHKSCSLEITLHAINRNKLNISQKP
jgi:hypothetical protein